MKHLQTFNEKNFFKEHYKDDEIILEIIKSIKEVCPPKNLKNFFYKTSNIKPKFTIKAPKPEKFQTITFFTTIKKDVKDLKHNKPFLKKEKGLLQHLKSIAHKDDFYVANVEITLYHVQDIIGSHMFTTVYVNNNKLICNQGYKDQLYSLLCDYIKKNNL